MRYLFTTFLAMALCLLAQAATETELVLWQGQALCDDFTNQPNLLSDGGDELRDADAQAGQEVRFYVTPTEDWWILQIFEGHWEEKYASFVSESHKDYIVVDLEQSGGYVSLFLTDAMLQQAYKRYGWGGAFVGNGDNCIVTKITLVVQADAPDTEPLMLNEIMQSNIDATMDDLNEFPDSWVELYNPNSTGVNLSNYRLGITADPAEAWTLTGGMLGAHLHKLVYCDKEARSLHTNFRLESGKDCAVYLFRGTELVDSIGPLKKQPAPNVAYGRQTDGAGVWGYQAEPTPGASNCGQLCADVLPDPVFSMPGSVITGSDQRTLYVTLPDDAPAGTELRYTLDGSEPTATSTLFPQAGLTFSSTRVVRVKPFCQGYLSPRSTTQSYIFLPRDFTIPVVSLVTNKKYFTDSKIGIYVSGSYQGGTNNYRFNWRRPVNFEYFTAPDEPSQLNQLCETRVAGAASRDCQLKSLALYAHKRFGHKRFDYELFPDERPGLQDYRSIVLRNAGNDFDYLYMRDAIIQRTMATYTDLDHQAYQPAIFYLNGEYKGMLNLRERGNEHNVYTNYDGLEDIDLIENWHDLKAGTWDNYNQFAAFYNEHGHTWDEYAEWMDLDEYINLMIMNLYYCNLDFPGNNFVMWRPAVEGGRWRFISKDTDFGLGLYGRSSSYNTIEWINNPNYDWNNNWANNSEQTRLFRRLMEDETFARRFEDRCAIYMGDFMNFDGTWAIWQPMYEAIRYEYPNHRKLINQWWPNYNDEINSAKNWLRQRTNHFYTMVANYYKLGTPRALQVNLGLTDVERSDAPVRFNGVLLSANKFDGKFFQDHELTLEGGATEAGRGVTGWTVRQISNSGQVTTSQVDGPVCQLSMPECSRLEINAIVGEVQAIHQVEADDASVPTAIYDVNGIRHDRLVRGHNIVVMGNGEARKIVF